MIKVILNALPPARIDTPSSALSTLKSFLAHHDVPATVIYWNLLLDGLLPSFERTTDAIHLDLLPFIYLIAGECGDDLARSRANAVIKAELPVRDFLNDNSDYLSETRSRMEAIVAKEFAKLAHDGPLLFGIPCKYEQWIPGIVLAGCIKKAFPAAKIVIGGLRNRDKAESVMRTCDLFDFAIWGEGEYPLLELCRCMEGHPEDLPTVPRLIFRREGSLVPSDTESGRFYDLDCGLLPDHDDYVKTLKESGREDLPAIFPLESSRGCAWNACRFCVYGEGYRRRKKDPAVLNREIEHLRERYGARYFAFMDNDIVANDPARLETILDDLIALRQGGDIQMMAEIVHHNLTAEILEKFPRAGFGRIHFGYEALSDSLLAKMRKRTNFSDNLFLVKFAHKFGIRLPSANVICGVIGETDQDILESIDNLHFLRFYFDKALFRHNPIPLRLAGHSDFYNAIPKSDLARWAENRIFSLLPEKLVEGIDRFSLFDFAAPQNYLWELFSKINDFYCEHSYRYSFSREDDAVLYREYFDGERVVELSMNDLAFRILVETNSRIASLGSLLESLRAYGENIDERSVVVILNRLREKHLVYFGEDYGSIVSVVDADRIDGCSSSAEER